MSVKKVFIVGAVVTLLFFILFPFSRKNEKAEGIVIVITGIQAPDDTAGASDMEKLLEHSNFELDKLGESITNLVNLMEEHSKKRFMKSILKEECIRVLQLCKSTNDSLGINPARLSRIKWNEFSVRKIRELRNEIEKSIRRVKEAAAKMQSAV